MSSLKVCESTKAIVVSGHDDATVTALDVLRQGGSLADAAIAGAAVLSVALPHACGLGGDAFILIHDAKSKKTHGINASGMSPALATYERFAAGLCERGPLSCNVPGMVAGWDALHQQYGRLNWEDLLRPAINFARNGIEVSRILARATVQHFSMLANDEGSRTLFLNDGRPLNTGDTLVQSALAQTLETIAVKGSRGFYDGEVATSIEQASVRAGALLRATDLAMYRANWVDAISTTFRGHEVRTLPPNSFGLYLLLQLMALEDSASVRAAGLASAERIARLVTAAQSAFSVGAKAVADPNPIYGAEPSSLLLGNQGRSRLRQANPGRPPNLGGTAVISVADHEGNAVTIIQSVFLVFGSGISDSNTGVLLNNRLFGFTLERGHPNAIAPHKRPAHTLCPAMAFKDGRLRYALTTPGGPGQTLTVAQVLQALIEEHASLEEAIRAPRWTMNLAGMPLLEDSMPEHLAFDIKELGVDIGFGDPGSPYFGSVKGIALSTDGVLCGVADQRRDATVRGL